MEREMGIPTPAYARILDPVLCASHWAQFERNGRVIIDANGVRVPYGRVRR